MCADIPRVMKMTFTEKGHHNKSIKDWATGFLQSDGLGRGIYKYTLPRFNKKKCVKRICLPRNCKRMSLEKYECIKESSALLTI